MTVRYTPSSVRGSDEASLSLFERTAVDQGSGPLIFQSVQQGSLEPLRLDEWGFTVEQLEAAFPVLETATDRTTSPVVRLSAGKRQWTLAKDEPITFWAQGVPFRVTLLKSLHFESLTEVYSFEGPAYYLEYVVTRATSEALNPAAPAPGPR